MTFTIDDLINMFSQLSLDEPANDFNDIISYKKICVGKKRRYINDLEIFSKIRKV